MAFPFLQSLEASRSQQGTALQMGGVLRYKLEVHCQYLSDKLYGLGVPELRRVTSTPDPDTFEKYRDTPPSSIARLLQKYALLLAESRI